MPIIGDIYKTMLKQLQQEHIPTCQATATQMTHMKATVLENCEKGQTYEKGQNRKYWVEDVNVLVRINKNFVHDPFPVRL